MRILLVEDDPMIGESVVSGLASEGHPVDWVRDGIAAGTAVATTPYALVLLDLGLPKRDGVEVLKDLRARKLDLPVLVMTARDTVRDRVAGLDAGADDYLVKPFDHDELSARVRALLRRAPGRTEPLVERGPLVYCAEGADNQGQVLAKVPGPKVRFDTRMQPDPLRV